jgi:hypothetical protein
MTGRGEMNRIQEALAAFAVGAAGGAAAALLFARELERAAR